MLSAKMRSSFRRHGGSSRHDRADDAAAARCDAPQRCATRGAFAQQRVRAMLNHAMPVIPLSARRSETVRADVASLFAPTPYPGSVARMFRSPTTVDTHASRRYVVESAYACLPARRQACPERRKDARATMLCTFCRRFICCDRIRAACCSGTRAAAKDASDSNATAAAVHVHRRVVWRITHKRRAMSAVPRVQTDEWPPPRRRSQIPRRDE